MSVCQFCFGQPVMNAATWIDGQPRWPAACPRCGETNEPTPERCICGAGPGQRHVPLCEAAASRSSSADTAAPPAPLSPPADGADSTSGAAASGPPSAGRPELEDLDIGREASPNPAWLRQLAETLKLEAALLEGYVGALGRPATWRAVTAAGCMGAASRALLALADALDGP